MVNIQHYWSIVRLALERAQRRHSYRYLVVEKCCKWTFFLFNFLSTKTNLHQFLKIKHRTNATAEENRHEIFNDTISYGILLTLATCLDFIAGIICIDCLNQAALRQITRIRIKFFESLMRQEIGWYDVTGDSNNFTVQNIE